MKKNEKKNNSTDKDVISEIKEEFKRHTTALMEHMTKEVKTVTEQYGGLAKQKKRVKRVEEKALV